MATTMEMAIFYIDSVDDENFLTSVMLEKDFSGRDSLRITVELELLELIQMQKVEATIKRIYCSDYEQLGSLMEMSTSYQMLFGGYEDIEKDYRFYKKRQIDHCPQSMWLYEVFKESMDARI
jgi:hypothetical protein